MQKGKAIRCLLDVLDLPESIYALPTDGRKGKELCRKRQKLAVFLATKADPDGTSIKVSPTTAAKKTKLGERTVKYLMKDLRTLGFLEDHGEVDPFFRTLVRSLNVDKMRVSAGVQDTPPRVQDTPTGVQNTPAGVQNRPYSAHNRPVLPPTQPPTTTEGGGRAFSPKNRTSKLEQKYMAEIGPFGRHTDFVDELIAKHGADVVDDATAAIVKEGFEGVTKSRIGVLLYRLPQNIAIVEKACAAAAQKAKDEQIVQAGIARQIEEHQREWNAGPQRNEVSLEDFLKS